jgi:hypothetical protein
MAALVKELLKDFHKLTPDIRCDLILAIQQLHEAGVVSVEDIYQLDRYMSGYNISTFTAHFNKTEEELQQNLTRIITAIEEVSKYLDKDLVHKAASDKRYPKAKISTLTEYLAAQSKNFNDHKEVNNV